MIRRVISALEYNISACICVKTFTGMEFPSSGLVETFDSVFGMSKIMKGIEIGLHLFYQVEIIQDSSLVSMHKGHTVQPCIFMRYRAIAQTKLTVPSINCSSGQ